MAKEYPHAMELNVLVIGMPNVGKSTLLNALRNVGIKGRKLISISILHFLTVLFFRYTEGLPDFRKSRDDAGTFNATETIVGSFSLCV